jgi:N6-adenosine-specific RNA methylase IME4
LKNGEKTISEAKKEEKKEAVMRKVEDYKQSIASNNDFEIDIHTTDKKFNIIYADPPWSYWEGGQKHQSLHYQTMSIDDIKRLPVHRIADENCILFLWATFPILKEAFELIDEWGFKYSTAGFVWVKRNEKSGSFFFGNGSWTRANAELCLIATKGSITRIDASISQVLDDVIGEHSEKPKRVRELITRLVGELPRVELFSRNTDKDGWFNWGNAI